MKILLTYATNSGSTYLVSNIIKETLQQYKHSVLQKTANETTLEDLKEADLVIIGSPSWLVEEKQGMPHETILELMKRFSTPEAKQKRFAVFGCGDSSYTLFCGAVSQIEEVVSKVGGTQVMPSLRIDGFYFNLDDTQEQAYAWAQVLNEVSG
jgi:flavodoxin I